MQKTTEMAFSCGSDFIDWHFANCRHCKKCLPYGADHFTCEIERELVSQFMGAAPISEKALKAVKEGCPEQDFTEEVQP